MTRGSVPDVTSSAVTSPAVTDGSAPAIASHTGPDVIVPVVTSPAVTRGSLPAVTSSAVTSLAVTDGSLPAVTSSAVTSLAVTDGSLPAITSSAVTSLAVTRGSLPAVTSSGVTSHTEPDVTSSAMTGSTVAAGLLSASFADFAIAVQSACDVVACDGSDGDCSGTMIALLVNSEPIHGNDGASTVQINDDVSVPFSDVQLAVIVNDDICSVPLSDGVSPISDDLCTVQISDGIPRKRKRSIADWKANKRKYLRDHGMEYTSVRGDSVSAKTFRGLSDKCCALKCGSRLTEKQGREIFDSFWALGSNDSQSTFVAGCVQQRPVCSHRVHQPGTRNAPSKQFVRKYVLPLSAGAITVCKTTFLSVLGVSAGRVDRVLQSSRQNGGIPQTDRRGRYVQSRHTIPTSCTEAVMEHIKSFPVNESHYTRAHSESRRYLSPSLTLAAMYKLYVDRCAETGMSPVKEWYYRHIFNTKFNLSFHPPRKDTCKRCDVHKVQLAAATADDDKEKIKALKAEHELHLRKAEAVRTLLNVEGNKSAGHEAFTFDLQKVLSLPKLSTNEVYYCRQLSVYNFGINSLTSKKSQFYVWDETVASRGAEDIGSCLLKYCLDKAGSGVKSFSVYSDACGGQNRNYKIALLWMHVCSVTNVDTIDHRFMISGHSYLPNDSDFGIIERATRKCSELYVPEQWCEIMENCNKKNPFTVVRMKQDMFVSVSKIANSCTLRKTSTTGEKVEWLKIQWLQVRKVEPLKLYYKYSVQDDLPFSCVDFSKRGRETKLAALTCSNMEFRALSRPKVNDLQKLMKYIPPVHHPFYQERLVAVQSDGNPEETEIEDSAGSVHDDDTVVTSPNLSKRCRVSARNKNNSSNLA